MNLAAEFINADLGIRSIVVINDGAFDVAAFDTDAEKMIAAKSFADVDAAKAYAAKFVADVIPANTFVTI